MAMKMSWCKTRHQSLKTLQVLCKKINSKKIYTKIYSRRKRFVYIYRKNVYFQAGFKSF